MNERETPQRGEDTGGREKASRRTSRKNAFLCLSKHHAFYSPSEASHLKEKVESERSAPGANREFGILTDGMMATMYATGISH